MSKQEEIKQALAAATPGPWEIKYSDYGDANIYSGVYEVAWDVSNLKNAALIAKAPEYIDWLLKQEQSLQEDIMVLKDTVHTKNVENERLRKEIIVKDNSKEILTKQITDEVAVSALAIAERDRLRARFEEKNSRHTKAIRLLMQVTDILSMGRTPDRAGAALKVIYKWLHENNPVGQEGEGNQ